jgi:putative membrane protein
VHILSRSTINRLNSGYEALTSSLYGVSLGIRIFSDSKKVGFVIVDIRKRQRSIYRKYRDRLVIALVVLLVVLLLFKELNLYTIPALVGLAVMGPVYLIVQALRYNHLYDEWLKSNEAWGKILSRSRMFARQLLTLISVHQSKKVNVFDINTFQVELINRQIALVYVMGYWLRKQYNRIGETVNLLPPGEIEKLKKQDNIPVAMLQRQLSRLQDAREMHMLDEARYHRLEATLSDMNESFEYCEKVQRTVYPAQMTQLGRLLGIVVAILSILYFSHDYLGWAIGGCMCLAVYYLELVCTDLEDPFSYTDNDIPVTYLSRMVESDLRSLLGETEALREVRPIEGILY